MHEPKTGHEATLDRLAARLAELSPESLSRFEALIGNTDEAATRGPGHGPPSSGWAWRRASTKNAARSKSMLDLLEIAGARGCTDPELVAAMGLPLQTVSPLRGGLFKGGLVVHSNRYRPNSYGSPCAVWVLASVADSRCQKPREGWRPTRDQGEVLGLLKKTPEGTTDTDGAAKLGIDRERYRQARNRLSAWGLVARGADKNGRAFLYRLTEEGRGVA